MKGESNVMRFKKIRKKCNILNLIIMIFFVISFVTKSEVFFNKEGAMVFSDSSIQRIFFDNIRKL